MRQLLQEFMCVQARCSGELKLGGNQNCSKSLLTSNRWTKTPLVSTLVAALAAATMVERIVNFIRSFKDFYVQGIIYVDPSER